MDFLIATAMAQEPPPPQAGGGDLIFFMVFTALLVGMFYLLLIRPQRKRMQEHQQMLQGLQEGDEVVTNGGELGRITGVDGDFFTLEVAKGVEWRVKRDFIARVMPAGTVDETRSRA